MRKNSWRVKSFTPFYETEHGAAYLGNSFEVMKRIRSNTVDLIMTSPPFALQRKKKYGNKTPEEYTEWFMPFAEEFKRVLKPKGSMVIDIGGSWVKGKPVKHLYQYELLLKLCSELELFLAQDLYWFNKARLPGPAQWVTVNRWRLKDAVDQVFWLSKTPYPKADNRKVLKEYSKAMKDLLQDKNYYKPNVLRPSEHRISAKFYNGNGGAISPNIFEYSNTDSQSQYVRFCKNYHISPHPARYPISLPEFIIKFLTDSGDRVLDPFAGSNTTGKAAEQLNRKWISIEEEQQYLQGSLFRFFDESTIESKYGLKKITETS